jgi:UDP-glucuronate 4-epimerase
MTGEQQGMACILVTGAAGFINFHLAERLLKCGEEVIGLDNCNDYHDCGCGNGRIRNPQLATLGWISCSPAHNEAARSHSIAICRIDID